MSCIYCQKEFERKPSMIKENNLCSVECRSKWNSDKSNQIDLNCSVCKKSYKVVNSRKEVSKTCSKECHYKYIKDISLNGHMNEILIKNGIKSRLNMPKSDTLPERLTEDYLINNSIKYKKQHSMYNKFLVDFYLYELDIVLEVFGDYWHGNPLKFNEEKGNLEDWQIKQRIKDSNRKKYLEKVGHKFVSIWECEIHENIEKIKTLILK